jgi:hypothetical protein
MAVVRCAPSGEAMAAACGNWGRVKSSSVRRRGEARRLCKRDMCSGPVEVDGSRQEPNRMNGSNLR